MSTTKYEYTQTSYTVAPARTLRTALYLTYLIQATRTLTIDVTRILYARLTVLTTMIVIRGVKVLYILM